MCPIVYLLETLNVQVRIDLRRRQAGMPEHLLNRAQVGTPHQQVGREAMPEGMGRDARLKAIACGPLLHDELQAARR